MQRLSVDVDLTDKSNNGESRLCERRLVFSQTEELEAVEDGESEQMTISTSRVF